MVSYVQSIFLNSESIISTCFCSIPGRKAIAVYPCEAEHNSELSFQVGEVFEDGKLFYHFQVDRYST